MANFPFVPLGDHILVRRLPTPEPLIKMDDPSAGMIIVEGEVLATGPGSYDNDGDFCPTTVKPGQHIMFNARWNDFANSELVGSNCDGSGPLVRPMPQWQWDKRDLYLITEGDIAGILATV